MASHMPNTWCSLAIVMTMTRHSFHVQSRNPQHRADVSTCCRANQFRVASVASSVFFLQNGAAAEKWPVLMEHVAAIEGAFRPRKECSEDKKSPSSRKRSANDLMQGGEFSSTQPYNDVMPYMVTEHGWCTHLHSFSTVFLEALQDSVLVANATSSF